MKFFSAFRKLKIHFCLNNQTFLQKKKIMTECKKISWILKSQYWKNEKIIFIKGSKRQIGKFLNKTAQHGTRPTLRCNIIYFIHSPHHETFIAYCIYYNFKFLFLLIVSHRLTLKITSVKPETFLIFSNKLFLFWFQNIFFILR